MSLSAPSLALVQHLRKRGAQTVDAILASHTTTEPRAALYRRLGNLEANGWVEKRVVGTDRLWAARADVPQRLRAQRASQAKARTQLLPVVTVDIDAVHDTDRTLAEPLPVVPPRQMDVMHAPVWQPRVTQVCRPGALDAARLPSRGTRC